MKKILVVVDYQNDFVDGALGFEKAKTLENGIIEKIKKYLNEGEGIVFTYDTHYEGYLNTREGKHLPISHCIVGTQGHRLYGNLTKFEQDISKSNIVNLYKNSFGISPSVMDDIRKKFKDVDEIEVIGIVTNMCVISNVVTFQSAFPNAQMIVDASLCASFDDEMHEKALDVMESMQVKIINREGK